MDTMIFLNNLINLIEILIAIGIVFKVFKITDII